MTLVGLGTLEILPRRQRSNGQILGSHPLAVRRRLRLRCGVKEIPPKVWVYQTRHIPPYESQDGIASGIA